MTPTAILRHHLPGRVRLAVPARRGDRDYFAWVAAGLREEFGCRRVDANPRTAGLLADGLDVSLAELGSIARHRDWFDLAPPGEAPGPRAVAQPFAALDARTAAAAAFLSLAVFQALRGQVMVPATSLVWYAMETVHWLDPRP